MVSTLGRRSVVYKVQARLISFTWQMRWGTPLRGEGAKLRCGEVLTWINSPYIFGPVAGMGDNIVT